MKKFGDVLLCCILTLVIVALVIGLFIGIASLIAMWLCNIKPDTTYSWYSGIWHGIFFLPNLVRSWFGNALYKAEYYTTAYNVWWWITIVLQGFYILGKGASLRGN